MSSMDGRASVSGSDHQLRKIEIEFMAAYEGGADIAQWIARYPEHAVVLTDLAIALDMDTVETLDRRDEDDLAIAAAVLRRARDEVLGTPPSPSSPGLVARAPGQRETRRPRERARR